MLVSLTVGPLCAGWFPQGARTLFWPRHCRVGEASSTEDRAFFRCAVLLKSSVGFALAHAPDLQEKVFAHKTSAGTIVVEVNVHGGKVHAITFHKPPLTCFRQQSGGAHSASPDLTTTKRCLVTKWPSKVWAPRSGVRWSRRTCVGGTCRWYAAPSWRQMMRHWPRKVRRRGRVVPVEQSRGPRRDVTRMT